MALFMPTQITPDVRTGIGSGSVDATQPLTVTWRINGASALQAFSITIFVNDANSTQKYSTGRISAGCPAYGVDSTGKIQLFSYTIPAAALVSAGIANGNEYKLIIQQWWSDDDSVTQSSASVFVTRATPTVSIEEIGTSGVISTRYYTFTGNYAQAQGDTLNWFRWRISYAGQTDDPFFDSGEISGTSGVFCTYDGFFPNTNYAVRLNIQTENGIEADTGWVAFSCDYPIPQTSGAVSVSCANGTDAALVDWSGIGYFPGEADGAYAIDSNYINQIYSGTTIRWSDGIPPMNFEAPWSVIWRGTIGKQNVNLFSVMQSNNVLALDYDAAAHTLTLTYAGATLAQQTGIINSPDVTVIVTEDTLYIRAVYPFGGLYPSATLYPGATLYPATDTPGYVATYEIQISYTQLPVTGVSVGGYQENRFVEIVKGTPSAETISAAINDGDYTPGLQTSDYMLVDWTNGINASTFDIGDDTLIGYSLYRRRQNEPTLVKVADTDIDTVSVYDYGAASQQGPYTYYLFAVGQNTYIAAPIIAQAFSPCWWNWTLMECEETAEDNVFSVLAAYRFRHNVETGPMSNNSAPNVLGNFTPYPIIQLSPQNYKSGTLTGLIGSVETDGGGQPEYRDSLALRDAIMALSVSANPLFLKNRKGDLLRVKISAPVTATTADATREQMQTLSVSWTEVGSAEGASLYALESKGVTP